METACFWRRYGAVLLVTCASIVGCTHHAQEREFITLTVALYPAIPQRHALFHALEEDFETTHPGVNVVLVDNNDWAVDYYEGGAEKTVADIYELDTILLSDFVEKKLIAPIDALPANDFAPHAVSAVTRNGKLYAVPRWLCGNLLFYRADARYVESSRTWEELVSAALLNKKAIFADLKGRSTLGEWYLTLLSEKEGLSAAQDSILKGDDADKTVLGTLNRILAACPEDYCRSDRLHDIPGFYAKEFIRGKSDAYIGYSETLHYAINELKQDCGPKMDCREAEEIKVRALPAMTVGSTQVSLGWVDALAISAKLQKKKKQLAMDFIRLAISNEAYQMALEPEWPYVPRYLLPARQQIAYKHAPLYAQLYTMYGDRFTGTSPGLNSKLRKFAEEKIDCALDRRESSTCAVK